MTIGASPIRVFSNSHGIVRWYRRKREEGDSLVLYLDCYLNGTQRGERGEACEKGAEKGGEVGCVETVRR